MIGGVFDMLSGEVRESLHEMGFSEPTPPQSLSIPAVLSGENVLLISPTGSGKTEAAVLPVMDSLISDDRRIGALYVTPLRALNRDLMERLDDWGDRLGLDIEVRHGDTPRSRRRRQALDPPHLMITTPETLQAILTGSRMRSHLSNVGYVVVDEVHELAASKRGVQLSLALERLRDLAGPFTRVGLSATVGNPGEVAEFIGGEEEVRVMEADETKDVELEVRSPGGPGLSGLTDEQAVHVREIASAVAGSDAALVFVNTRQFAEVLASRFKRYRGELGVDLEVHHGSLSREARVDVEDRFKSGDLDGLICTSSLELGIDVGHVDRVVQYMSPRQASRLLQRVGRSGHTRAGTARGTVIASTPDEVAEALVISGMALSGEAEDVETPGYALDVLANQVCGSLLGGETTPGELHAAFGRARPYRGLDRGELEDVIDQLRQNRIVSRNGLKQTGKAYSYFYRNLSTIPDEKTFTVEDRVSGSRVGTLDEVFVTGFLEPGAAFICRGETWRVLEVGGESVTVEPLSDPTGAVPSWVGEEIPVPWDVARGVGRLRREVAERLLSGGDPRDHLAGVFPTDHETASVLVDAVEGQLDEGSPVPGDDLVTVESHGDEVVINSCFGHRVNEALGRVVSALLAARLGSSVALEAGAYRIVLNPPVRVPAARVSDLLDGLEPESVEPLLSASVRNSSLYRWVLLHVARRFGAVSKDADRGPFSLKRMAETYSGTPMEREALREIMEERLDVRGAERALRLVGSGEVRIEVSRPSALGTPQDTASGMVEAGKPDLSILKALRKRIMNDRVILFCLNCREWTSRRRVGRVDERPECPLCESGLVAALKPWEDDEVDLVRRGPSTRDEERRVQRVYQNANLVLSSGRRAVIALAARGVGPTNASRVLKKPDADEWEFYRRILDRERNYARTHGFWD